MRIIKTAAEMRAARTEMAPPVGLMATLGGMHRGHEVLLDTARGMSRTLVASLFLNPAQFGQGEDLETYPADTERDLEIFEARGADYIFMPPDSEMYAPSEYETVDPGPIGRILEGKYRPGHFRGVATVVGRICSLIRPDLAVWGAKDAQQNVIIGQTTEKLGLRVRHHIIPTVREPDGLALSSRNAYLAEDERRAAAVLYRALQRAEAAWRGGEVRAERLLAIVRETVRSEPLVKLQYVSAADPVTLEELRTVQRGALISLAAFVGRARLIDNLVLGSSGLEAACANCESL